jgi:serine/threonine protein kinase
MEKTIQTEQIDNEIIGYGSYGCVYKPSLRCEGNQPKDLYDKKVSKVLVKEEAKKELKEYQLMDKIDKEFKYHLKPPVLCKMSKTEKEKLQKCKVRDLNESNAHLLIMENAGKNLEDFVKYINSTPKLTQQQKQQIILRFWKESVVLIDAIEDLMRENMFHADLKPQNIVFNMETFKVNIIDFGIMQPSLSNFIMNFGGRTWWNYPPETLFLPNTPHSLRKDLYFNKNMFRSLADFSKTTQYNYFLQNVSRRTNLNTFSFKTKEEIKEIFDTNFYEGRTVYDIVKKTIKTFDMYGLGISLMYVLIHTSDIFVDDTYNKFISNMYHLLFSMIHPDCFMRPLIPLLKIEYDIIIDLLTEIEKIENAKLIPIKKPLTYSEIFKGIKAFKTKNNLTTPTALQSPIFDEKIIELQQNYGFPDFNIERNITPNDEIFILSESPGTLQLSEKSPLIENQPLVLNDLIENDPIENDPIEISENEQRPTSPIKKPANIDATNIETNFEIPNANNNNNKIKNFFTKQKINPIDNETQNNETQKNKQTLQNNRTQKKIKPENFNPINPNPTIPNIKETPYNPFYTKKNKIKPSGYGGKIKKTKKLHAKKNHKTIRRKKSHTKTKI